MPLSATLLMMWLLIFNSKSASISEISTSLLGMFYLGYLPSFWVRLRSLSEFSPNKFHSMAQLIKWLNPEYWTVGVTVTWWTWTSIVFAGYFSYYYNKNVKINELMQFNLTLN
jgi:phosphatidate cytidylyltransferase